jgi:hypothetical protein
MIGAIRSAKVRDRLGLLLGLALFAFVLSQAPLGAIGTDIGRLGPMVLLAPVLALGWHACNTCAFRVLLDARVPWRTLYWNRLVGDGYNNLIPLGGVGGEPFKLRHLSRYLPAERVGVALVRDRIIESGFGFLTTGLLLVVGLSAIRAPGAARAGVWVVVVVGIAAAALSAAVATSALPGRLAARLSTLFGAGDAERVGTLGRRRLGHVVCWHMPARVLGLTEVALLLWLLNIDLSFARVALVDSAANVAGVVGFMIPQGLGVLEGATLYAFASLGHPGAAAVAFALSRRGRLLLLAALGVGLHTVSRGDARGRPRAATDWDADYQRGVWRFLGSHDEAAHYALIAGLVQRFAPRARLLDAGCGTGLLYDLLRHTSLASYRGVDVSPEAIRDATARLACDRATFAVADFESAVPSAGAYDAIVFNESIYYAADPAGTLRSYLDAVGVDGVVIVSVRRRRRNRRIVQALRRSGPPVLSACVGNRRRQRWDVDVFGKPGQPAAAPE